METERNLQSLYQIHHVLKAPSLSLSFLGAFDNQSHLVHPSLFLPPSSQPPVSPSLTWRGRKQWPTSFCTTDPCVSLSHTQMILCIYWFKEFKYLLIHFLCLEGGYNCISSCSPVLYKLVTQRNCVLCFTAAPFVVMLYVTFHVYVPVSSNGCWTYKKNVFSSRKLRDRQERIKNKSNIL